MKKYYSVYSLAIFPITVFFIFCTWDGMLKSPDSEFYLHIARNFVSTGLFRTPGGNVVSYWPPLYYLILTPYAFIDYYPWLLHLALLITYQVLLIRLAKDYLTEKSLPIFALLSSFSTLTLMVAVFVWSELLFMVLLLGVILTFRKLEWNQEKITMVLFTVLLGCLLLTRNAGIFFIPPLVLFILIHIQSPRKLLFIFCILLASLGNLFWNLSRIVFVEKLHMIGELFPQWSPLQNFILTLSEIGYNLLPRILPAWFATILVLLLLISGLMRIKYKMPLYVYLAFGYTAVWFLIPAPFDHIGRFLAPVWPLFLLFLFSIWETYWQKKPFLIRNFAMIYLLLFSLIRIVKNAVNWGPFDLSF